MSFFNFLMLAGLAGVAIPPIIHLLNRRRYDVVDWGAMQFLQVSEVTRRRLLLEELLLMLLRMGLIGVLVCAFAGPFTDDNNQGFVVGLVAGFLVAVLVCLLVYLFADLVMGLFAGLLAGLLAGFLTGFFAPDSVKETVTLNAGRRTPRDVVLIFDGSASMSFRGSGKSAQEQAKEWATTFVDGLAPGDGIAILVARKQPLPLLGKLTSDPDRVRDHIQKLPEPNGSCDWPGALQAAYGILEQSQRSERDILLIGDGQRYSFADARTLSGWKDLAEEHQHDPATPKPPKLWVVNLDPKRPEKPANWSLAPLTATRAVVAVKDTVTFHTALQLSGDTRYEPPYDLRVEVDGKFAQKLEPPKNAELKDGKVGLSFPYRFEKPGTHLVTVRVQPDPPPEQRPPGYRVKDHLPIDNRRDLSVEVVLPLPVLLVDSEEEDAPRTRRGDFLRSALGPKKDTEAPAARVKTVSLKQFTPALLRAVPQGMGKDGDELPRVLILCNVPHLSDDQQQAVEQFLHEGGGVLVTLGDRTEAGRYNAQCYRDGKGWLPARLDKVQGDNSDVKAAARPRPDTFNHPALQIFRKVNIFGNLDGAWFARWWRVKEPVGQGTGTVVARLNRGDAPFLVEKRVGDGRVLLCTVPLDDSWRTNVFRESVPAFTPFAHQLIAYLAGSRAADFNLDPGQPLRYRLAREADPRGLTLQAPSDRRPRPLVPVATEGVSPAETYYRILVPCRPEQDADVREILTRDIDEQTGLTLHALFSLPAEHEDRVEVIADVFTARRDDRSLEKLAERLRGEPGVSAVIWERSAVYRATVVEQAQGRLLIHKGMRETGVWRLTLPTPPNTSSAEGKDAPAKEDRQTVYYVVQPDPDESDLTPLDKKDRDAVAHLVKCTYENEARDVLRGLSKQSQREEFWSWFLLGVVALLCSEVWFTRRVVKNRAV